MNQNLISKKPLLSFFILAFLFTWLILSPGVAANLGWIDFNLDGTVLTIFGGLGPLLAVLVVTYSAEGKAGIKEVFQKFFQVKAPLKWWAASILLLAGLFGIALFLNSLIGGRGPDPQLGIYLNGGNIFLVILLLLIGSLGEEPGWRGFALPRLQEGRSPLKATLILTLIWWLWHLPTYWTLPLAMNAVEQFGFLMAYGIQFVVLFGLGILTTWVFNGSRGSVIMPILIHVSWNFWSGALGQEPATFLMPLMLVSAIAVGFATRGKLGTQPSN